jgi:hypothetical protein
MVRNDTKSSSGEDCTQDVDMKLCVCGPRAKQLPAFVQSDTFCTTSKPSPSSKTCWAVPKKKLGVAARHSALQTHKKHLQRSKYSGPKKKLCHTTTSPVHRHSGGTRGGHKAADTRQRAKGRGQRAKGRGQRAAQGRGQGAKFTCLYKCTSGVCMCACVRATRIPYERIGRRGRLCVAWPH